MTKVHEEFIRGTLSEVVEIADSLKGEMVVVIAGNSDDYSKDVDMSMILKMVNDSIETGMTTSEAIKSVAGITGVSKYKIYDLVHGKNDPKERC